MSRTSVKSRTAPRGPISIRACPSSRAVTRRRSAAPGKLSGGIPGPTALNTRSTTPWTSPSARAATISRVAASLVAPYGPTGTAAVRSFTGRPGVTTPYSAAEPMWTSRGRRPLRRTPSSSRSTVSTLAAVSWASSPAVLPAQFTITSGRIAARVAATSSGSAARSRPAKAGPLPLPGRSDSTRSSPSSRARAAATARPRKPRAPRTSATATYRPFRNWSRRLGNSWLARS